MTLREILHQCSKEQPDAWLYLPGDAAKWTLDTEAYLLDLDALDTDPESHEPILPPE
jgi:hypothetical protein